jgi:hypothetical protein
MNNLRFALGFNAVLGYHAAGQGTYKGTGVKNSGADSALALMALGAVTNGTVITLKLQASVDDVDGDYFDAYDELNFQISGQVPAPAANQLLLMEVPNPNPAYPWIRPVLTVATQNAEVLFGGLLLSSNRFKPVTQPAGVVLLNPTQVKGLATATWNGIFPQNA